MRLGKLYIFNIDDYRNFQKLVIHESIRRLG